MDTWVQITYALKRDKIIKQNNCSMTSKYFHSGRKSNFGLNIAWKQSLNNIGFVVRWAWPFNLKGFTVYQFCWSPHIFAQWWSHWVSDGSQSVWTLLRMLLLAGHGCCFLQIHCFFLTRWETPESAHYPYPDETPAQDGLNEQGVHHFPPLVAPQRWQPPQPQHTLLWTIDHAPSWALGRIGRTCGRWRWQGRP